MLRLANDALPKRSIAKRMPNSHDNCLTSSVPTLFVCKETPLRRTRTPEGAARTQSLCVVADAQSMRAARDREIRLRCIDKRWSHRISPESKPCRLHPFSSKAELCEAESLASVERAALNRSVRARRLKLMQYTTGEGPTTVHPWSLGLCCVLCVVRKSASSYSGAGSST